MSKLFHVQVAGEATIERLQDIGEQFAKLVVTETPGGVITTPADVTATILEVEEKIDGIIVQPRATILDIALAVFYAQHAFRNRGKEALTHLPSWSGAEEETRNSVVVMVNMVLRGADTEEKLHAGWSNWLRTQGFEFGENDVEEKTSSVILNFDALSTRDMTEYGIVISIVNAMFHLLPKPSSSVRQVLLLENPEERSWKEYSFLAVRKGNVIKFDENADMFLVTSDPYVNYLNNAVWTCDVQPFTWEMLDEPEPESEQPDITDDDLV